MNNYKGGWNNKKHSFINRRDLGNKEEEINKLVRRMNKECFFLFFLNFLS